MYTDKNTLGELLEEDVARRLLDQLAPGMAEGPQMEFVAGMSIERLIAGMPEKKKEMFELLLDAANGKEVEFTPVDPAEELPEIEENGTFTYDIDDVDGSMYMLEHRFSGCLVVHFSKKMDESVYGKVTLQNSELKKGFLKSIEAAGGIPMLGIPVRGILKEYDREYELKIEGFKDTYGNIMKPQTITVRTLPKSMPDPIYYEHDQIALKAAREGIVLLKNENHILPLKPECEICVNGADSFRIAAVGAGRINPRYNIGLNRALTEYSRFKVMNEAEYGIIIISRPSGENFDNNAIKGEFYLSDEESKLVDALCEQCKHLIAIINSGYPIDLRWTQKQPIKAVLWCGFPGMLGGQAVAEILDGRVNPSGKLPDTWSIDYKDIPSSANFYQARIPEEALGADAQEYIDTYYEEDIYVGYRYFETFNKPVAYPFGFGLSYTTFSMDAQFDKELEQVQVQVKNIGSIPGKEVIQVYVEIPDGKLEQPSKRLIGFEKTKILDPGREEKVFIPLEKKQLASYDTSMASWIMEPGCYRIYAGSSVKKLEKCGEFELNHTEILKKVENLMSPPVVINVLSKNNGDFPKGEYSGIKKFVHELEPKAKRKHYPEEEKGTIDFITGLSVKELARLSVCASHGWGMHEKGEAGKIYKLENHDIPDFRVADGNNGVNIHKPNIGMPCSNTVCASWNIKLAYEVGRVIAEEAQESDIQMILAPAMNIHRNPLNGRHPEYFSEDPYLTGIMAGNQGKGIEDYGVSSSMKHAVANNCEASRKRNQSIVSERALREIYLKVFEVAMQVYQPDSIMTAYNAVNGCFTAEDEEMIQGVFRREFGFEGFVMTDWNSYDTVNAAAAVQAGNCWLTPGSVDDTYVTPIVQGVEKGEIDLARLQENVRVMLRIVEKRRKNYEAKCKSLIEK